MGSFVTSMSKETCQRTGVAGSIEVGATVKNGDTFVYGSNYIEIAYKSTTPLTKIEVLL
jgi:hypothetical protein